MTDWFATYFDEDYFKLYSIMLTPEASRRDAAFVSRSWGLKKKCSKIMDLGCGQGRISILLAKAGQRVMGIDLSDYLLKIAKREAAKQKAKAKFLRKDMRKINFKNEFDAVICMLTSFGYFGENDNRKVIKKVAESLVGGGKFLLDVGNPEWMAKNMSRHSMRRVGDLTVEENRSLSSDNKYVINSIKYLYLDAPKSRTVTTKFRQYKIEELKKMLEESGLSVVNIFGDYDVRKPLDDSSKRVIILSQKPFGRA
jgi:SAM-dependent methyltransferase